MLVAVLLALLSGGMIVNIVKEEIRTAVAPGYPALVVGTLAYAAVPVALEYSLRAG